MAILSALISMLSKKIGDLLQILFGWSLTGLFGRLPSRKQTALSVALILAIVWPLLVAGCFVPGLSAWAIAFVPLHHLVDKEILRIVWMVLSVLVPIGVGFIVAWVAPARKQRGSLFRTIVSGYPLTLGMFLSFLLTFLIVPVLKVIAMARRYADEHVYLQPHEGAYLRVVEDLADACDRAGIPVQIRKVPLLMRAPTSVLKWFARSSLDPIIGSEPRMLRGAGVELYLYPSDLFIRGVPKTLRLVRAAMVREMLESEAYLTADPKAQELERQIGRLWRLRPDRDRLIVGDTGLAVPGPLRAAKKTIDEADIPYEDWILLYTKLHRIELRYGAKLLELQTRSMRETTEQDGAPAKPRVRAGTIAGAAAAAVAVAVAVTAGAVLHSSHGSRKALR